MKIAFLTTKYRNQGGTFNSFLELKKQVSSENQVDCFCIGTKKDDEAGFIYLNSEKSLSVLDNYDIVHLFKLWNYEGKEWLTEKLVSLAKKKKLILTLHDVKDVQSKSKTNVSSIFKKLLKEDLVVLFHGEEEMRYYTEKYPIEYYYYIPHPYTYKCCGMLPKKNKIVVVSRIDFCKGIEFIYKFMQQKRLKYPIEFWSGNINEAFVYFTGFGEVLKSPMYKKGFDGTIEDYHKIYSTAKILLNFTWWGEGSGGRTELTMLESWDFGCIPFVDKRWCSTKNSILVDGYNCVAIERNDYEELQKKLDRVFKDDPLFYHLQRGGYETLKEIMKNNHKINDVYTSVKYNKQEGKRRNLALFDE